MSSNFQVDKKFVKIEIDKVYPNKYNNNVFNPELFDKLKENIQKDGFNMPIIVREISDSYYEIVDGEHRYKAMKELGEKFITCVVKDKDSFTSLDQKKGTLSYNKLRGSEDHYKTSLLINDIVEEYGDDGIDAIIDAGFSETELKMLQQSAEAELDKWTDLMTKSLNNSKPHGTYKPTKVKNKLKQENSYRLGQHIISFSNPRNINILRKFISVNELLDAIIINIPVDDIKIEDDIFLWLKPLIDRAYEIINPNGLLIIKSPHKSSKNGYNSIDYMVDTTKYLTTTMGFSYITSIIEIRQEQGKTKNISNAYIPYYVYSMSDTFELRDIEYTNDSSIRYLTNSKDEFIDVYYEGSLENNIIYNLINNLSISNGRIAEFFINKDTIKICNNLGKTYIGIDNRPMNIEEVIHEWELESGQERKPLEVKND